MRFKTPNGRTSPRRRRAAIAFMAMIAILLAASFRLTRPSRFSQVAESPAEASPSALAQVTASVSLSHEYVRRAVDRTFSRAVQHADREVRSEVERYVEERGALARLAVPDMDRLHFSHTVATEVTGGGVRFVVSGEGHFDVPWSRADYGLSLQGSIGASPRMSARSGTLAPNLSVEVREFRTGDSDRSALLRRGGEFTARFYTSMPFAVDFPVAIPSLDSIVESIEGDLERAARDAVTRAWNDLCEAFPLRAGSTPAWLLARPTGLRFRQVRVTPRATTVQMHVDVDARRVTEQPHVECPFPERVTVTDTDLLAVADPNGRVGDVEATVAAGERDGRVHDVEATVVVDVGLDVLGDLVHVFLQESGTVPEMISVEEVRIGRHDRGADGPDGAAIPAGWSVSPTALLLEADIEARALGMRAKGTIYVSAVPVVDDETGGAYLAGIELDTESRHPLLAAAMEAGEAVRAVFAPYDGEPVGLWGDFLPYLGGQRVVGLEVDETRVRMTVQGRRALAVR